MAKKSNFKRFTGEALPANALTLIKDAKYKGFGGYLAAWFKGEKETAEDWILVMVNGDETDPAVNVTLFRDGEGNAQTVKNSSMYQTFLTHKALRFGEELPVDPGLEIVEDAA